MIDEIIFLPYTFLRSRTSHKELEPWKNSSSLAVTERMTKPHATSITMENGR